MAGKKCPHDFGRNQFCKDCSQIKMVMLKEGEGTNGVWYSYLGDNGRRDMTIIQKMVARFRKQKNISDVVKLEFYDRTGMNNSKIKPIFEL